MGPQLAVHANDDSVKATEFRHGYVDRASEAAPPASRINVPNEKVEQLAANTPTIPQDAIASLLQRLVRSSLFRFSVTHHSEKSRTLSGFDSVCTDGYGFACLLFWSMGRLSISSISRAG